jgi:hypothetical protein
MMAYATVRTLQRGISASMMLALLGCGFSHEDHIDGPYYLVAVDTQKEMDVSYKVDDGSYVGRIPSTVFSFGWNANYIVAKRHPPESPSKIDYYYLIRKLDGVYKDANVSVRGPLSEHEFSKVSKEIGLPEFSKTLKKLE